jgi:hypothetical protein
MLPILARGGVNDHYYFAPDGLRRHRVFSLPLATLRSPSLRRPRCRPDPQVWRTRTGNRYWCVDRHAASRADARGAGAIRHLDRERRCSGRSGRAAQHSARQ